MGASYLPVLGAPLIWDDHHLIERNPLVQQFHSWHDYFGQGFWQSDDLGQGRTYYRPLIILSLAVDHRLFGDSPGGFHATNLFVHLLSTVLLFRLLRVRGTGGYAAVLGAALWALHPRLTEAVAWISGRTDVLASFFVLAALLALSRATLVGRIACALLLLLGLLCKEIALAGVAAVLLVELVGTGSWLARFRRALPSLLSLSCYLILRAQAAGVSTASAGLGRFQRTTAAVGHYFAMLLTPWLPNTQIGDLSEPRTSYVALGCVVLLALGWWTVYRVRTGYRPSATLLAPLALTVVGFGLVLHVVPLSLNVVAADRFLYLPLIGLTLLLTPVLAGLPKPRLLAGAASLLALSFGAATFVRANTWSDEVELWTTTFHDNPGHRGLACSELGRLYARAGLFAQAYSIDQRCETRTLIRLILINNAATLLARAGHYREAIQLLGGLDPAARREPVFSLNLALFRSYLNDFAGARAALAAALQIDPTYADGLALAARLPELQSRRRHADALSEASAPVERARLLGKLGLAVEALHAWQTALANPALSRAEFEEGMWFALAEGDAVTIANFRRQYRARFADSAAPLLELAFDTQRELAERLLLAWPGLNLPLLSLPG